MPVWGCGGVEVVAHCPPCWPSTIRCHFWFSLSNQHHSLCLAFDLLWTRSNQQSPKADLAVSLSRHWSPSKVAPHTTSPVRHPWISLMPPKVAPQKGPAQHVKAFVTVAAGPQNQTHQRPAPQSSSPTVSHNKRAHTPNTEGTPGGPDSDDQGDHAAEPQRIPSTQGHSFKTGRYS